MPLELPPNLVAEKNKLQGGGAWLALLDINLKNPAGEDPPTIYLVNNTEVVTFDGHEYQPAYFELIPPEQDAQGSLMPAQLKTSSIGTLLRSRVEEYNGGVGSVVKVQYVNVAHLDSDYSELELDYEVLSVTVDESSLSFSLGTASLYNRRYPQDRYLPHCGWKFLSCECGYVTGGHTFCRGTYDDCVERGQTARFGGFMGLARGGLRIA